MYATIRLVNENQLTQQEAFFEDLFWLRCSREDFEISSDNIQRALKECSTLSKVFFAYLEEERAHVARIAQGPALTKEQEALTKIGKAINQKRLMATWLWQALFVLAVIGSFVSHHLTVSEMMSRIRFVAMDSRDTFYLANLGTFDTARHIHAELAKMAAETIFSRNPDGFDNPERLERLFNPASATALNKAATKDADVFRSQQIHEKFETGQIRELEVDDNTALVSVEGQVLRTAFFNQRLVNDTRKVTVFLRLRVNEDMALNGRYPLVVTNYEERFE
jgi:hypothetical protein